jgi:F-type H+-transporting ATPase subunit alpha
MFQLNNIKDIKDAKVSDSGFVVYVKDGICEVTGLGTAMAGELVYVLNRDHLAVAGMVLQILFTTIIIILFGPDSDVDQDCVVVKTDKLVSVSVDLRLFGQVLNGLGHSQLVLPNSSIPKTASHPIFQDYLVYNRPIDTKAAGIIARAPVRQPMQTGILAVDSLTPIGCGQRELIIGDRQTGKTTMAVDSIINQGLNGTLHCIYVAIGQKRSAIVKLSHYLATINVMRRTIIVSSSSAETATLQYLSPFTGCTLGEWLGANGGDSLVVYDDLSKQAVAYRQISLLLRRSPSREAYPGDVFYLHARLLERAAK